MSVDQDSNSSVATFYTGIASDSTGATSIASEASRRAFPDPEGSSNSQSPRVFTYPDEYDEVGSALTLTPNLVWQLNTVFRCENRLARYQNEISKIQGQQKKLGELTIDLHHQLEGLGENEGKTTQLGLLATGEVYRVQLQEQMTKALEKFGMAEDELRMPKADLFQDLKHVMAQNNLLEDISGDEGKHVPWNERFYQLEATPKHESCPILTASQAEAQAAVDAREDAAQNKIDCQIALQEVQRRLNNWESYYYTEKRLKGFRRCQRSRHLPGAVLMDEDQESRFPDFADDGYRISQENDFIQHCDRAGIQRWLGDVSKNDMDIETVQKEVDEWECREVKEWDSVSCVAEGKEKERIKREQAIRRELAGQMDYSQGEDDR
ncbi:hypothetical protein B0J14DRAFT_650715 [Halenospora varia]|nr:hypothetical protein B0J14DRAFT_650715 [Halenospora varia]